MPANANTCSVTVCSPAPPQSTGRCKGGAAAVRQALAPPAAFLMELRAPPPKCQPFVAPYQLNTSPACMLSSCSDKVDPSQRPPLILAGMRAISLPPPPSHMASSITGAFAVLTSLPTKRWVGGGESLSHPSVCCQTEKAALVSPFLSAFYF